MEIEVCSKQVWRSGGVTFLCKDIHEYLWQKDYQMFKEHSLDCINIWHRTSLVHGDWSSFKWSLFKLMISKSLAGMHWYFVWSILGTWRFKCIYIKSLESICLKSSFWHGSSSKPWTNREWILVINDLVHYSSRAL